MMIRLSLLVLLPGNFYFTALSSIIHTASAFLSLFLFFKADASLWREKINLRSWYGLDSVSCEAQIKRGAKADLKLFHRRFRRDWEAFCCFPHSSAISFPFRLCWCDWNIGENSLNVLCGLRGIDSNCHASSCWTNATVYSATSWCK